MSYENQVKPPISHGYSSENLAKDIAKELDTQIAKIDHREFDDGEIRTEHEGNIRSWPLVHIASGSGDPNTQIIATEQELDAAKYKGGAKPLTLVLPYMFYGRGDSTFGKRAGRSLRVAIKHLRDDAQHFIVVDPHNHETTETLFGEGKNFESFTIADFAYPYAIQLKHLFNEQVICANQLLFALPDAGAGKRITPNFKSCLYKTLGMDKNPDKKDWPVADKNRDHEDGHSESSLVGDFTGKDVVLFEDMIASGGTACKTATLLKQQGARSVVLFATSGLFTSKKIDGRRTTTAIDLINNSDLDAVFITDTYDYRATHRNIFDAINESPIIHVIKSAPYLAAIIKALHLDVTKDMDKNENSVSAILRGEHTSQICENQQVSRPTPLKPNSPLRKLAFG